MPRAAKVCATPGCPEVTPSTHCPAHTERHGWHRKDPGIPDARGWAWSALRKRALDRDGHACVQCGRPATEVDHIIPRSVDPTRATDLDNLRSLCKPCHRDVTNRQRRQGRDTRG